MPDDIGHVMRQVPVRVREQLRISGCPGVVDQTMNELSGLDVVQVVGPVPVLARQVPLARGLEDGPEVHARGPDHQREHALVERRRDQVECLVQRVRHPEGDHRFHALDVTAHLAHQLPDTLNRPGNLDQEVFQFLEIASVVRHRVEDVGADRPELGEAHLDPFERVGIGKRIAEERCQSRLTRGDTFDDGDVGG